MRPGLIVFSRATGSRVCREMATGGSARRARCVGHASAGFWSVEGVGRQGSPLLRPPRGLIAVDFCGRMRC